MTVVLASMPKTNSKSSKPSICSSKKNKKQRKEGNEKNLRAKSSARKTIR